MKKKILILGISIIGVISILPIIKKDSDKLLKDNIINNYNAELAVNISEDGTNYSTVNEIPTSGYQLNNEKSICKTQNETSGIENAPKDNNITIEYKEGKINFLGVTKQRTRCYLYFDKKDEEKPTITNVTTSVTKTEINVSVTATDNEGVTEYWYQLNSNTPVKGTGNTHKFTGLSAGTTYTVKVYVKDAAGNQSDTTTKSVQTTPNTSEDTLSKLNVTVNTGTPNFANTATANEGVYKVSDGMYGGYSYYWRGAATNNYVKFGGFCWRIVRINGDGTMRLIYDGATCHSNGITTTDSLAVASAEYNKYSNRSEYVGWRYSTGNQRPSASGTASNANKQLESWYSSNLASYASKIADGKYCNDRNLVNGYSWSSQPSSLFYYAAYGRLYTNKKPTLNCAVNDIYSVKIGLITADEVAYAGAVYGTANVKYYLYNGQDYWTMTPMEWYRDDAHVSVVDVAGRLGNTNVNNTCGLRPVINLRSDVTFSGGNGTQSSPYVVQ
jgi:hypothetical protein